MSRAPQVFHRSFGQGPRSVLAVHCSLAHSGAWRGVAEQMAEEVTLTGFDMLSHGRSPDWDGQGNYQLLNMQAGLSLLTVPVDLVGHSFGATVALRMAMARPDLVRSLTLIEPVLFAAAQAEDPAAFAALEKASQPAEAAWEAGDRELTTRLFNRMWGIGEVKWPDLPAPARAAMLRAMPVVMASRAVLHEDANGTLAPGALAPVTMPVQILTGADSPPVIPAIARSLCRRLNAAHTAVPGAGHMLPLTHPAQTVALLRSFWHLH
ncbi:alpha/beta fold hydrolase [Leisingera sp. ANG-S5]|uniref:alpha/beta fold hydrolase n=1 Tax=Leisingera sp. ANG-S5 TaxID=1577901 RepID=UPI0005800DA8|nr:alpha/beta hydrolase [Leisingera sp. ANG-S5]KIC30451.1 alpha/beta hydrolase [Leisingera sp. ANG-S5]